MLIVPPVTILDMTGESFPFNQSPASLISERTMWLLSLCVGSACDVIISVLDVDAQ